MKKRLSVAPDWARVRVHVHLVGAKWVDQVFTFSFSFFFPMFYCFDVPMFPCSPPKPCSMKSMSDETRYDVYVRSSYPPILPEYSPLYPFPFLVEFPVETVELLTRGSNSSWIMDSTRPSDCS